MLKGIAGRTNKLTSKLTSENCRNCKNINGKVAKVAAKVALKVSRKPNCGGKNLNLCSKGSAKYIKPITAKNDS